MQSLTAMALYQDIRYGLRVLLHSPVASTVAVLSFALGIGVNISSFVAVNSVVLHPFAFPHFERIMTVWETLAKSTDDRDAVAPANYLDWRAQSRLFQATAAYEGWAANLTGSNAPIRLKAALVTSEFFQVLGVQPALGRTFTAEEAQRQGSRAVVVSDRFWREHLSAAPDAIGLPLALNGERYSVIGVMPQDFDLPLTNDIWAPLVLTTQDQVQRSEHRLQILGLLKPGVTIDAARKEADQIGRRLEQQHPLTNRARSLRLISLTRLTNQVADRFILLLLGSAIFVLLLACANVANLQLAQATIREREMSVRAALGASRLQIARQLIVECLLIAIVGGLCALFLAGWNLDFTKARIPPEAFAFVAGLRTMHIDAVVIAYTLGISLLTGLLASLPAVFHLLHQLGHPDLNGAVQKGGRTSGASRGRNRLQSTLIVYEVAMALTLLVNAKSMVDGFKGLLNGNYGYDPKSLLRLEVSLPSARYNTDPQVVTFYDRVLDRFKSLPATDSAAIWSEGPGTRLLIEGRPAPGPGEIVSEIEPVSSAFLTSMHVPLLQGRFVSEADRPETPAVAVLSASVAHHYWPDSDAVGHRLKIGNSASPWITVVGVSGDIVQDWLTNRPSHLIYIPYTQRPPRSTTFLIRTRISPKDLAFVSQQGVRTIDKDLPIYAVKSMEKFMMEQTSGVSAAADAMSRYALVAILLAATGIFGVISYFVAQRTRDIGVRMALGANTKDVLSMTVRRTLRPALVGILIGTAEAYGLSKFLSSFLFQLVKTEAATFLSCALVLAAAAFLASYFPARRATRVDPLLALREG